MRRGVPVEVPNHSGPAPQVPSLWTKFSYGAGAVAFGVKDNGFSYFLLLFYSQVIGIDARLVPSRRGRSSRRFSRHSPIARSSRCSSRRSSVPSRRDFLLPCRSTFFTYFWKFTIQQSGMITMGVFVSAVMGAYYVPTILSLWMAMLLVMCAYALTRAGHEENLRNLASAKPPEGNTAGATT